jgi:predicted ATPase/DNA-binding SARP family transcriptional activator
MLEVRVLGPVEVSAGGTRLDLHRPLELALLTRLALAGGKSVADDVLAHDLWGDVELARPVERLRVLAFRLRRSLGIHADAVRRLPAGWAVQGSAVDLAAVVQATNRFHAALASGDLSSAEATGGEALQYWRGPALAGLRAIPYAAAEGERLDAEQLELRTEVFDTELAHGGRSAGPHLARLVYEHPLHERLVGLLAVHLYREGRQAEALEQLAELRRRLSTELGVDPSPVTAELELKLLRQDPELLPAQHPVPNSAPGGLPSVRFPESASAFVGRTGERAALLTQVGEPGVITLIGGPGVGKTRLAREVSRAVQEAGRPVAWLDLAPLRTADALPAALAAATGVEPGPSAPLPRCASALSGALLVVDNAEHLIDAAAELISELRRTAEVTVLVTSQRPLRIAGEETHHVGPLAPHAAVTLFCSRSGAKPSQQVDVICAAVDRLPLGVELAAGLTRTLTVEQLADRIGDRLRLLVAGSRDVGHRDTSLRAAIDWCHDLLDPTARAILRRLAVFSGGCTLEAAEDVLADEALVAGDIAPAMTDLIDRSLLTVHTSPAGTRRFGLLEVVRDYAADRLHDSGEETAVRNRHVAWCRQLAKSAAQYGGSDHAELLAAVTSEEPNLRAAIAWCLGDAKDPCSVLDLAAPTWWYWWTSGQMAEARRWLRVSLAASSTASAERAAGLRAAAALARNSGDYEEARALGEESLRTFRLLEHDRGITAALIGLNITSLALGDLAGAIRYGEESRDRAAQAGDRRVVGAAVNNIGIALRCLGRTTEAEAAFTEALELWRADDDLRGMSAAIACLAIAARQLGDLARSPELGLDSLRRCRDIDLAEGQLDMLDALACLDVLEDRPASALRLLAIADRYRAELGTSLYIPDEVADRTDALTTARRALGADAQTVEEAAGTVLLTDVVAGLLDGNR